jgi:hypothetical protein
MKIISIFVTVHEHVRLPRPMNATLARNGRGPRRPTGEGIEHKYVMVDGRKQGTQALPIFFCRERRHEGPATVARPRRDVPSTTPMPSMIPPSPIEMIARCVTTRDHAGDAGTVAHAHSSVGGPVRSARPRLSRVPGAVSLPVPLPG